ncbi:hypothetical protein ElyMa_000388900 [Elysia marginata]|uniref:Uncharacterized protein n=1 Tax=Elysia marginata TaxID=1093978 RepID=A0AAV4FHE3_9GAST|nr:hypothetical protein ElyMa_000388900 [Elysia marginata]
MIQTGDGREKRAKRDNSIRIRKRRRRGGGGEEDDGDDDDDGDDGDDDDDDDDDGMANMQGDNFYTDIHLNIVVCIHGETKRKTNNLRNMRACSGVRKLERKTKASGEHRVKVLNNATFSLPIPLSRVILTKLPIFSSELSGSYWNSYLNLNILSAQMTKWPE